MPLRDTKINRDLAEIDDRQIAARCGNGPRDESSLARFMEEIGTLFIFCMKEPDKSPPSS
jgi:hypothetical protein